MFIQNYPAFWSTQGMEVVDTGPQTLMKAEGEKVTLGCRYTPSPADTGDLDIEWSVVSPDTTQKDLMVRAWGNWCTLFNHVAIKY